MKTFKILLILFCVQALFVNSAFGQDNAAIKLIGSAYKDSICLRWAPSTPVAWKLLNKYGYRLERYTLVVDSTVLKDKPVKNFTTVFKPAGQPLWQKSMNDDYVAISAQAIYGEDFKVEKKGNDIMQIVQQAQDLEMRYSFTLLAADVSPVAADLSGLRFVDKDIKKNEKYLYRIYSLVPENILKIELGFFYIGSNEVQLLPQPITPEIKRTENKLVLKWETSTLLRTYTGYFVERSEDGGKTFKRITTSPIVNILGKDEAANFSVQTDSIINETVKYHYVIRGITPFGEVGPPSEMVTLTTEKPFTIYPAIIKTTVINNASVELKWSFPPENENEIQGFQIERKTKTSDQFKILATLNTKTQRSYRDNTPQATNYYRVEAFTPQGQKTYSYDYLVQLEDSIPPLPPTGLTAVVDTLGFVTLSWKANTEPDLIGYRVFKSSFKNSEFGQVTVGPVSTTSFKDTVNIKTLSKNMWYKIVAVDSRFNPSDFSKPFRLSLPDVIPPVQPVINFVRSKQDGVEIKWINSTSEDVSEHHLYRRETSVWELIKKIPITDTTKSYFDKITAPKKFQYALAAVDSSRLKSALSMPVWGEALRIAERTSIKNIEVLADRVNKEVTLKWVYNAATPVDKFLIYRSHQGSPLALYKSLKPPALGFRDRDITMNTEYVYHVKVLFKDGSESSFSDGVKVNY